jgi:hypothetical protein
MEASLSLSDDARHGVAACPQVVSVCHPPGGPVLPDTACEAVFRSECLPVLTPACICGSWVLANGSLVRSRRRAGTPRRPWKTICAGLVYGSPEIKLIALALPTHHHGQEGARGFRCFSRSVSGRSAQSTFGRPPRGLI